MHSPLSHSTYIFLREQGRVEDWENCIVLGKLTKNRSGMGACNKEGMKEKEHSLRGRHRRAYNDTPKKSIYYDIIIQTISRMHIKGVKRIAGEDGLDTVGSRRKGHGVGKHYRQSNSIQIN